MGLEPGVVSIEQATHILASNEEIDANPPTRCLDYASKRSDRVGVKPPGLKVGDHRACDARSNGEILLPEAAPMPERANRTADEGILHR